MSTEKLYRGSAGWYLVKYPADWRVEESEDLVTFYRPESGTGALQISAFRTPGQQDTRQVLYEYVSDQDLPIDIGEITVQEVGPKGVSTYHYVEADWYRKVWVISQESHLLFITYNCKAANKEQEWETVLNIVNSVTIES